MVHVRVLITQKPSQALFWLTVGFGVLPSGLMWNLILNPDWQFDLMLGSAFTTSVACADNYGKTPSPKWFFIVSKSGASDGISRDFLRWRYAHLCRLIHTRIPLQILLWGHYLQLSLWRITACWCALWFSLWALPVRARQLRVQRVKRSSRYKLTVTVLNS